MKKIIKKLVAITLCICSLFTVTACGGGSQDSADILYVGIMNGGLGTEWLEAIIANFEEDTGIDVFMDTKKAEYRDDQLLPNMSTSRQSIYILDDNNYANMYNQGLIADMTDVVTEKVYDEDGEVASITGKTAVKSIEDITYEEQLEFCDVRRYMNNPGDDPVYFAIPNYLTFNMITYDADLFDEKGYYFDENNDLIFLEGRYDDTTYSDKKVFVVGDDEYVLGTGPDMRTGTLDDGLPITWNDMISLMDQMVADSIIPFTWSGAMSGTYTYTGMLNSIIANYEGADVMKLISTHQGTYNGNNPNIPTEITPSNSYKLSELYGKKAAMKAMYDILSNEAYFSENAKKSGQDNLLAQKEYAMSPTMGEGKRIAMYTEATYWEAEAKAYFIAIEKSYPQYGWGKRNFKCMPMPNFIGVEGVPNQTNTTPTLGLSGGNTFIVMNKTVENNGKRDMAKQFLQYMHSRTSLALHNIYNGSLRPFEYNMTATELAHPQMTPFARNIWKYHQAVENGDYATSATPPMAQQISTHYNYLNATAFFFSGRLGASSASNPYGALYTNKWTVDEYYRANNESILAAYRSNGLTTD